MIRKKNYQSFTVTMDGETQSYSLIELRDLSYAYPDGRVVFESLNVQFPEHRLIKLQGPSGSGKSTALRLIARLLAPASGDIVYRGITLHEMDPLWWRREIRYVQQTPVIPDTTVRSFLLFGLRIMKKEIPTDKMLYTYIQHLFEEEISLDEYARNLSLGQQQRLGLLRAAITDPAVLLFDEPTSALDRNAEQMVEEWMLELRGKEGKSIVVATHRDLLRNTDCVSYRIDGTTIRCEL